MMLNDFSLNKRLSLAFIVGWIMTIFWYFVGDPWGVFGDATWYMRMYNGEAAPLPFGYRLLTPLLARILPFPGEMSFTLLTMSCLVLITLILISYCYAEENSVLLSGIMTVFWISSFAFIYYSTTIVRTDGPMLLLLGLLFLWSKKRIPWLVLWFILALGILAHETILIFLAAIWLDKLFGGRLTGGGRYPWWQLAALTILSLTYYWCIHKIIPVLPAQSDSYISSAPLDMIATVLHQNGGLIKQAMRIYSAYGPALIFACFYCIRFLATKEKIAFLLLLLSSMCISLLAIDTLRVMAIVYLPVLYYAAQFGYQIYVSGQRLKALLCMASQIAYTIIVFGHLRTFESSLLLNGLAIFVSIFALIIGFMSIHHKKDSKSAAMMA